MTYDHKQAAIKHAERDALVWAWIKDSLKPGQVFHTSRAREVLGRKVRVSTCDRTIFRLYKAQPSLLEGRPRIFKSQYLELGPSWWIRL